MKKIFGIAILVGLFSLTALADIAPLPIQKPVDAQIGIFIDKNTKEPTLVISRELIAELANSEAAPVGATNSSGQTQTLVSGLFLTLTIVFGGVWLARSRNIATTSRVAIGVAAVTVFGIGASIVFGNAAPPLYQKINSKIFSQGMQSEKSAYGAIKIEVSDDANKNFIQLNVPEEKSPKAPKKDE